MPFVVNRLIHRGRQNIHLNEAKGNIAVVLLKLFLDFLPVPLVCRDEKATLKVNVKNASLLHNSVEVRFVT